MTTLDSRLAAFECSCPTFSPNAWEMHWSSNLSPISVAIPVLSLAGFFPRGIYLVGGGGDEVRDIRTVHALGVSSFHIPQHLRHE